MIAPKAGPSQVSPETDSYSLADAARQIHEALKVARVHVKASCDAEHMMDGFGPRQRRPSDPDLETLDAAIASYESALAAELPISISARDPRVIIAGIRQFGLASDGSDLNDLERALVAPPNVNAAANEVLSNLRGLYNAGVDPKRDPIAVAIISEALALSQNHTERRSPRTEVA